MRSILAAILGDLTPTRYVPLPTGVAWRLEYCPHCGYDLQGSPPTGICPECGHSYDCSRVVLHGYGLGQFGRLRNMPLRNAFLQFPVAVFPLGVVYYSGLVARRGAGAVVQPIALVIIAIVAAYFVLELLIRGANGRPWLVRIDFTQRGLCQIDDFDPDAGPYVLLTFARAIFVPGIIAAGLAWLCWAQPSSINRWIALVLSIAALGIAAVLWRGRRIIAGQAANDPNLQKKVWVLWSEVRRVHLAPKGGTGEYMIGISRVMSVEDAARLRYDVAHALVRISPNQIDALVRHIAEWNPAVRITTTRQHPGVIVDPSDATLENPPL